MRSWLSRSSLWLVLAVGGGSVTSPPCQAQDGWSEYRRTADDNLITRLQARIDAGEVTPDDDESFGSLPSLLRALEIPLSSQSLVFSKTSLQMGRISPENPRAIYFNDDVYVAWVRGSPLLEIATTDPRLGAAFYTVRMNPRGIAFRRENDRCLACHQLPSTQGIPGHVVRSVLTRASGTTNSLRESYVIDHASPIEVRWAGWYVTGDLGGARHRGNAFLDGDRLVPEVRPDRDDLGDDLDVSGWPTPYSDVVALMVLEHQTQTHNVLARANRQVLSAAADDAQPLGQVVRRAAAEVADQLLFRGEATLEAPIRGTSGFTEEFSARGLRDAAGRSLRDFDLSRRLFRYPLSYLIDSYAFDSLDERLRQAVYRQLWRRLTGGDVAGGGNEGGDVGGDGDGGGEAGGGGNRFPRLSLGERLAIIEIVRATKSDLPQWWDVPR